MSSSTPHPNQANANYRLTLWQIVAIVVGLVISVATFFIGQGRGQAEGETAQENLNQTITVLLSTVGELQSSLSSATTAPTTVTQTVTATQTITEQNGPDDNTVNSPGAPEIRHSGPLIVRSNSPRADPDAPADDANWGRFSGTGNPDIYAYDAAGLNFSSDSNHSLWHTAVDYGSCSTDTRVGGYTREVLVAGDSICMRTNEGRISIIEVTKVTSAELQTEITTWKKDTDA